MQPRDTRFSLCFSSLGCPEASPAELCETACAFGIRRIELRSLETLADYPAFLARHPEALDRVADEFRTHGIVVPVVASSFNLLADREDNLDYLLDVCRVADRLKAPYVRVFGGGAESASLTDEDIEKVARLYDLACRACVASGGKSKILVETHGGFVTAALIRSFSSKAKYPLELLWDCHHTWKLGGENPHATFGEIGSLVRHIHCKDSISKPGHGYAYVLPGHGEFPFRDLFLSISGLDCSLSLEWEKQWHPDLPPLNEAMTALKNSVESFSSGS